MMIMMIIMCEIMKTYFLPYVTIRTFLSNAVANNGANAFIPSGTKYMNKVVASSNDIFKTLS
jgi:hypothetical protein